MKTARLVRLFQFTFLCLCACGPSLVAFSQTSVTIDFNSVQPYTDFSVYSEDGFTLIPNVGRVRINSAFPPFGNAAQPSFGFGQGMDSGFTFTSALLSPFALSSLDLLEATDYPDKFGVTLIGTRSDFSVVTQTLTLDGIPGAQTFAVSGFADLRSLRIAEDSANGFYIDLVQIDNVQFTVAPEPSCCGLLLAASGVCWSFARRCQGSVCACWCWSSCRCNTAQTTSSCPGQLSGCD